MYNNNITKISDCQDIFAILSELARRKVTQKKLAPAIISAFRETPHHSNDKERRIKNCGSFVGVSEKGRIISANFCKNRFCPICQWRLSLKTFGRVAKMQEMIDSDYPQYQYIFATFTIRNVKRLEDGVRQVLQGFNNLTHDRFFRQAIKGFIRTVEITYNAKKDTWHPHAHVILAVDSDYYTEYYKRTAAWALLWKRATRLNYVPIVYLEAVYKDRYHAIAEVVKYAVKPLDLEAANAPPKMLYAEMIKSMFRRRLRSFGGVYKSAAKKVGLLNEVPLTDAAEGEREIYYEYKDGRFYQVLFSGKVRTGLDAATGEFVILGKEDLAHE